MIFAEDHTLQQLKLYCEELNLSSSGTKAALVARLNSVPSEVLNNCVLNFDKATQRKDDVIHSSNSDDFGKTVTSAPGSSNNDATEEQQQQPSTEAESECEAEAACSKIVSAVKSSTLQNMMFDLANNNGNNENIRNSNNDDEDDNEVVKRNEKTNNDNEMSNNVLAMTRSNDNEIMCVNKKTDGKEMNNKVTQDKEKELLIKEISLLKRERELLVRENKLLNQNLPSTTAKGDIDVHFSTLKELLPSCNGGAEFKTWFAQLNTIKNTYNVSEKNMRALICSKLEENAKAWLYSKPYFLDISVEDLMQQMKEMFDVKINRITSRRNFEERKWKYGEKFVDYYNAKVILSNDLRLHDDELLEYLVDGISSLQLRTQAKLQNYKSKEEFLQIFKGVEQQQKQNAPSQVDGATKANNSSSSTTLKCFNCNSAGHLAAVCRKPRREFGSCYACGEMGHFAKDCPQYKKSATKTNEYNAS